MTPEQFVKCIYSKQRELVDSYFHEESKTHVSYLIETMNLSKAHSEVLEEIFRSAFSDLSYTILLGLDGVAQLGGIQQAYQLLDEGGNELSGGKIESYAWEYFHKSRSSLK